VIAPAAVAISLAVSVTLFGVAASSTLYE
jgi:hypothetical protein